MSGGIVWLYNIVGCFPSLDPVPFCKSGDIQKQGTRHIWPGENSFSAGELPAGIEVLHSYSASADMLTYDLA